TLVMISIIGMLESQTRAALHVATHADNQELVRQTLVELQRDLRAASAISVLPDSRAQRQIDVMHTDFRTGTPSRLRWRVDASRLEIVREQLAVDGSVETTTHRLRHVRNVAMFAYFDGSQAELEPGTASASTIGTCALRIRVTIAAAPTGTRAPIEATSEVDLRNRRPGNRMCVR
ncbi:MAG: hypothetical protein M3Q68_02875, partial [Actinomycetota bacterium]|nr:hypothetical protein [Actinomycetota bacterium]